ncbi:MAG: serine/threonine-protein kinase [Oscillatoria sp. PMC 1051.18]|nr:serine/threonine-protein kinase [Oscillatoria sp. PMC 1050.18]MEC5028742.1 serine/threonine-protein kinase [Oscillatoria sp. PMC 1051.18]
MNFPRPNLSSFHSDILQDTLLGQLCGQEKLFRDRYLILRMLGRGGFGVTFLARNTVLPGNPLCVIKQLCPKINNTSALATARQRFKREAKTLSLLGSHSQIPLLLDYFVLEEDFFLVQEYVRGITLARLVRRYGCQSENAVKQFLRQMLPALQYIHSKGVIHRDIKPQNIIRCQDDGRLVLIDFGAVKEQLTNVGDTSFKSVTTNFIGTVGFAPPEQFCLRPVYASDLYALGVTCLYLLTAKAPLDFDSDRRTGEIIWRDTVEVSPSFGQILDKMLKVNVQQRYQNAAAIIRDLEPQPSQPDLTHCMTVKNQPTSEPEPETETPSHSLSYAQRTGKAIREWKSRFHKRQQARKIREIRNQLYNQNNSI